MGTPSSVARLSKRRADVDVEHDNERSEASGSFPCHRDTTRYPVVLSVCEASGRASIVYMPPLASGRSWYSLGDSEVLIDCWGEIFLERSRVPDLVRAERNRARAVRRAKQRFTDYIVGNRLGKMWTFTCADQITSREAMWSRMQDLFRRWRELNGREFPYAYVLERHKSGAWHAHVMVSDSMFTDFFRLRDLWGHGRIRFDEQKSARNASKAEFRRLASYGAKYLAKGFGDELATGRHAYEVAEGFQPSVKSLSFATVEEAKFFLQQLLDSTFVEMFASNDLEQWDGPPVWCYQSP